MKLDILRKKFPDFAVKCERNLEENRINQEYTQRIKKWMSPYSFKRRALEKEHTELLNHLNSCLFPYIQPRSSSALIFLRNLIFCWLTRRTLLSINTNYKSI